MIAPEEPFSTSVLGGVGIGKTHENVIQCQQYASILAETNKHARKVIILNFQNEEGYAHFKTLEPTPQAITDFVRQKTVEVRQILPFDRNRQVMTKDQKVDVMQTVLTTFRNGLVIFDDIDGYGAHKSSSDDDLISMLMGLRHKGCDVLFAHQAWRKLGVTEIENLRFIRLHRALDTPESLPKEKLAALDFNQCMIAHYAVEAQFELAHTLFESGKIDEARFKQAKSYHVYIDRTKRKLFPISPNNFNVAVKKFLSRYPKVIKDQIDDMVFNSEIDPKARKENEVKVRDMAISKLQEKFAKMYLKK